MYKKICITNRKLLCPESGAAGYSQNDDTPAELLIAQLKRITEADARIKPDMVILREKDLSASAYELLAKQVIKLCKRNGVQPILHTFSDVAAKLKADAVHMPLRQFMECPAEIRRAFATVGVSIHTAEEAKLAERNGASYVTASPIYETSCKPLAMAKGLDFLREVAYSVQIPVYALGGVRADRIDECIGAGASGVCMMSEYMLTGVKKQR